MLLNHRVCVGAIALFVMLISTEQVCAFRSGPPPARNGSTASGGATCRQCHGNTIGTGSVQILGAPTQYQANVVYDLTVRVADATKLGAGFQISVENSAGQHRGTLIITDAVNTRLNASNPSWVNHTSSGVDNSVLNWAALGNAAEFDLQWRAPLVDSGALTFWAAGNAINNNFSSTGDIIYLVNATASFAPTTGACCDDLTGDCTEGRTEVACEADGFRYGGDNSTCATIDPPCISPEPVGACCDTVNGICADGETEPDCEAAGFDYGGDGSTCATLSPPCVVFSIGLEDAINPQAQRGPTPPLVSPITVTHAGDGSGRLFVVDQVGQIRIIDSGGSLLPIPFLDISAIIPALNAGFDERGLLGLAFHPNYPADGRFFIRYSLPRAGAPEEPCNDPDEFIVGCHEEILAEYMVSGVPNVADPGSERILFRVDKPQFNHNGGAVAFGPDGMLYFTYGDGGGAHDGLADVPPSHGPIGNGQNKDTALGKVLRIDVDSPPDLGLEYAIPPTNPFVGVAGLDEIYAFGFRNPFAMSFDDGLGGTNDLYLADVGQALFEEVDIVVSGGNYGWVIREGFHCFDAFDPGNPPPACPTMGAGGEPLLDPVSEYTHAEGGISVIGGFVYRGSRIPGLQRRYVYGDFSADFGPTGRLYYFDTTGADIYVRHQFHLAPDNAPFGRFLKGFGEDEDGELYVCASSDLGPTGSSGVVLRIVSPAPGLGDDTCQTAAADLGTPCSTNADCTAVGSACGNKSRYLSITPANGPLATTTIQIEVVTMPQFPAMVGDIYYAGPEQSIPNSPNPALRGAPVQCTVTPNAQNWTAGALHLFGSIIVPGSTYNVRMCDTTGGNCSDPLLVATAKWGDVIRGFGGGSQPNFGDVNAVVQKFSNLAAAPSTARSDLVGPQAPGTPNTPNQATNFSDVSNDVSAFSGFPYPYTVLACP